MYRKMLLGGLLTKGLKAAVKSKPYQQFEKGYERNS